MRIPAPVGVCALLLTLLWLGSASGAAPPAPADDLADLEALYESTQKEEGAEKAFELLAPKFEALARERTGTDEGLGAELWLLRMHWWQRSAGTMQKNAGPFARRLIEKYGTHAELKRIPEFSYLFSVKDFEEITTALRAITPHTEVKAACLYSLGRKLVRNDDAERARKVFLELKERYADEPYRYITYGEIAAAHLSPHEKSDLGIGDRAPEIVGVDVNGQAMKLSDYRGKVVVLDFWGDW